MAKLEHLPPELLRLILLQAAYSSTKQALNLALVCHTLFDWVRPALHASVALRTRDHLEHYAQLVSADPERAAGLRNLYLNNRSDGDPAPALPETTVEGVANWESGDQWATNSLETICERCVNLEVLHVWEPFTINYPSEISNVFHLTAYPLEALGVAYDQNSEHTGLLDSDSASRTPPPLRELTISSLAVHSSHLALAPGVPAPAVCSLTHLHLHWPTLSPAILSALCTLPKLTHLRLTRPSPNGLVQGVSELLTLRDGNPAGLQLIILELGWYIEGAVLQALGELEDAELRAASESIPSSPFASQDSSSNTLAARMPPFESFTASGWPPDVRARARLRLLGRDRERKISKVGWLQWDESAGVAEWQERVAGGTGAWGWR